MPGPAFPPTLLPAVYDGTRNGDGSVTIHDVPILGPMDDEDRVDSTGAPAKTDRAWMRRVIANHTEQLVGGYVAPLHDGHNSALGGERPSVGSFVPTTIRDVTYEGRTIPVLCADLTVDAATFAAIRSGRYPYRSVEIADWGSARITSLALMSGSAPYWRFPVLREVRVREPMPSPDAAPPAITATAPAPGFADAPVHLRARALARLAALPPADDAPADPPADGAPPPAKNGAAPHAEPDGDEAQGGAMMKAIEALSTLVAKVYEALAGKKTEDRVQPARDEPPEDSGDATEDEPDEDEDTKDAGKPASKENAKMAATTTPATLEGVTAQLAALTGKVAALDAANASLREENAKLSAKIADGEKAAETAKAVAAASAALRAERVILPTDFDATAAKMHAAGALDSFVATLKASGRRDPPATFSDAVGLAGSEADAPEVMAFAKHGAAKLEAARKSAREFAAYKRLCPGSALTLEEHLRINVK